MKTLLAGLALALAVAGAACAADRPEGRWVSQTGNVVVEVGPCGPALCGAVVRVMGNVSMSTSGASAAPPARVGQQLMTGFRPSGAGQWTGKLFNRENGQTYDCVITPHGRTMTLRAYVLIPWFGRDIVWMRAG
jgi:uncharacterized protein (DUF2147 family)